MQLSGKSLVAAMCLGQVGNLLPHVVVPAVMAQHLIPLWSLSASRSGADGELLRHRLHAGGAGADRADRPHGRAHHPARWFGRQRSGDARLRLVRRRPCVGDAHLGPGRHRLCRRLHAGTEGADRPAGAGRHVAQRHALHGELLVRRRAVVPDRAACGGQVWMARRFLPHRAWAAGDDRGQPRHGRRQAEALIAARCSISSRCSATGRRSATSSATARTASSSMPCAHGSCLLGLCDRRATAARRCWTPSRSASSAAVLAMPASIIGNEAAIRFGRHRAIIWFMCMSGVVATLIGFATDASPAILLGLLLIYSVVIPADSGALTSGMSASAAARLSRCHDGPAFDGGLRLVGGRRLGASVSPSMRAAA